MSESDVMAKPPTDAPATLRWLGWFLGKFGIAGGALAALLYIQQTTGKDAMIELRQIRTVLEERLPAKKEHARGLVERDDSEAKSGR